MLPSVMTVLHDGPPVDASLHGLLDTRATSVGINLTMSGTTTPTWDDGMLISVSAGDVVFRKVVYADGRFQVQIEQHRDRVALTGSRGRASVTFGLETASFVPHVGVEALDRVRRLLVLSPIVAGFRRFAAHLEKTGRAGADALSVRLTAALVAETAGEQGTVVRLIRATAGDDKGRFRRGVAASARHVAWRIEDLPSMDDEGAMGRHPVEVAFQCVLDMESRWFAAARLER
jgi:hypothetical protein